jgi:hypothetical protein
MNAYGTISQKICAIASLPSIVFRLAQRRVSRIGKKPQTGCGGLPSLSPRAFTDRRSVIAPMANGGRAAGSRRNPSTRLEGGHMTTEVIQELNRRDSTTSCSPIRKHRLPAPRHGSRRSAWSVPGPIPLLRRRPRPARSGDEVRPTPHRSDPESVARPRAPRDGAGARIEPADSANPLSVEPARVNT